MINKLRGQAYGQGRRFGASRRSRTVGRMAGVPPKQPLRGSLLDRYTPLVGVSMPSGNVSSPGRSAETIGCLAGRWGPGPRTGDDQGAAVPGGRPMPAERALPTATDRNQGVDVG